MQSKSINISTSNLESPFMSDCRAGGDTNSIDRSTDIPSVRLSFGQSVTQFYIHFYRYRIDTTPAQHPQSLPERSISAAAAAAVGYPTIGPSIL